MNTFQGGFQSPMGRGGFMNDNKDSPSVDSSQKQQKRSQTLMPVTGAILAKAEYNVSDDVFSYNGVDIHQVTFVGIIREVNEATTNISYKIDDQTGSFINVKKWVDQDEGNMMEKRSECREDTYVRVVGHMKSFNDGAVRNVIAFSMTPVLDFNEITFHMLEVIHAHLQLTKGIAAGNSMNNTNNQTPMRDTNGLNSAFGGGNFGGGGSTDNGLTGNNKTVYQFIDVTKTDQGISITELRNKCRGLNENALRNALEFLSNEGHIYSTIDDDHFRSTSN